MPVGLEAEATGHHAADEDPAGEVAEVPRVVMCHEAAGPGRPDLTDAVDVALRGRQRHDLLAPVGPEEELQVGLERGRRVSLSLMKTEAIGSWRMRSPALSSAS